MIIDPSEPCRPGRPKSDAKRRDILRAAGDLFTAQGYRETSMDAIAARAGVSKQTVYSHFQNKEELLRACVHDKLDEYELNLSDVSTDQPLATALQRMGESFISLLGDPGVIAMHRLLISESQAHPRLAGTFYEAGPIATMQSLAHYLEAHPDFTGTGFSDSLAASEVFFSLLKGSYFPMMLLNLRPPMPAEERGAHVALAVERFLVIAG